MQQKSSICPQICAAVSASLIFVCAGIHMESLSVLMPKILMDDNFSGNYKELTWIPYFLFIGVISALPFSVILVDKLGRRTILLFTVIPLIISCVLITFAMSYWWFYLARYLAGIAIGVGFTVTPMYIGEIAESRIRGGLCVLMFVMFHLGRLIVVGIGLWMSRAAIGIVGAIIPIVFGTALLWVPESPYYYAIMKIPNQTRKNLAWLRGTPDVLQEAEDIRNSISLNQRSGGNLINLFKTLSNRKASAIVFGLLSCQQISNISIIYYAPFFYNFSLGIGLEYFPILRELIMLLSTIFIVPLVDVAGRRPLLLASASLCAFFSLATALYLSLYETTTSWILPIALLLYVISYSIGIGTIPIVFCAELFPCEVKGFALGLSTAFIFVLDVGMAHLYHTIMITYGFPVALYVLVGSHIVTTVFIFFVIPETKKIPLTKIQEKFHRNFRL